MLWLSGPVRVVERKVVSPAEGDQPPEVILQPPTRMDQRLWLALDCSDRRVRQFVLKHPRELLEGPFYEATRFADPIPRGATRDSSFCRHAEAFTAKWGFPELPRLWRPLAFGSPRPVLCFALDEFERAITMACALGHLLRVTSEDSEPAYADAVARIRRVKLQDLVPVGGQWVGPSRLRGSEAPVFRYLPASHVALPIKWPAELLEMPVPDHTPEALYLDPFLVLRWLCHDPDTILPRRDTVAMRQVFDFAALGVAVYLKTRPESLFSFLLEEWVLLHWGLQGGRVCCHIDERGQVCGRPLPESAPANRRFCAEHQSVRARERKRTYASERRKQKQQG